MREMLTVGEFTPVQLGENTIRRYTDKYEDLQIGDQIRMTYVRKEDLSEDGNYAPEDARGIQILKISAISIGRRTDILDNFGAYNHRDCDPRTFEKFLDECYPGTDDDDIFIAISF